MSTYLYGYSEPLVFDEENPKPPDLVFDQELEGSWFYLSGSVRPDGYRVGAWDSDGNVALQQNGEPVPIEPVFFDLRPFGNDEEGNATDQLDYHHWMGHLQRQVQPVPALDTLPVYPADNQPIVLTMARVWDDTPGWEGWGWLATIEFSDPARAPDARAIGIYDADWNYLYTTGAFIWSNSGEVDDEGQPVFKWQTQNPAGKATAAEEPVYYALLHGSLQEGRMVLSPIQEKRTNCFWEAGQTIPGGEAWVDSGETVTGMAGTVTLVSGVAPFPIGTQVRIEGVEMAVTSIWNDQGLVLEPYRASTTDAMIEIWQ